MEKPTSFLLTMSFFEDFTEHDISYICQFLEASIADYEKGQIIFDYDSIHNFNGIVLDGEIGMIMHTRLGRQHTIQRYVPGDLFFESCPFFSIEKSMYQVLAHKKSKVLLLKFENLYNCTLINSPSALKVAIRLIKELTKNNLSLHKKFEIVIQKHIRDKIFIFLQSLHCSKNTYIIPFDRQAWANYIGVERSALSRELSMMKQEGLLTYHKNKIIVSQTFFHYQSHNRK